MVAAAPGFVVCADRDEAKPADNPGYKRGEIAARAFALRN
jgi:phage/plasmid primase-like uncharacterized protein